jgi:hypothetical protein
MSLAVIHHLRLLMVDRLLASDDQKASNKTIMSLAGRSHVLKSNEADPNFSILAPMFVSPSAEILPAFFHIPGLTLVTVERYSAFFHPSGLSSATSEQHHTPRGEQVALARRHTSAM